MDNKVGTFTKQSFPKTSVKFPFNEVLSKLNLIEQMYTELMGPRDTWDKRAQDCLSELRMNAICKQTDEVEDLERQYESRNSIDY